MTRLYSYCLPFDDGAAPNPFWGTCTLVVCKPAIRRTAEVGDWIVGTGSKNAPVDRNVVKDLRGRLVYAMQVTQKMTLQEYDRYAVAHLPEKVPAWSHHDWRRRLGDALYDFSGGTVVQRKGVHQEANMRTDLSGKFALLSDHFNYFGANAILLPDELRAIAQNQVGHRVKLNDPHVETFEKWIQTQPSGLAGAPLLLLFGDEHDPSWCASYRKRDDDEQAEDVVVSLASEGCS